MASALPGDFCVMRKNVCILRVARLDTDCSPTGGADSGIVSAGIVTMTASPEVEEGTVFEPKNGCGRILATVSNPDILKRYNLTGEILTHDVELIELMFGGSLVKGRAAGSFSAQNIGWASPGPSSPRHNGVYLEVIAEQFAEGAGDCAATGTGFVPYTGHIFGKALLTPGDNVFEEDVATVQFTGKAFQNPNLFDGPWNDFPGVTNGSPYVPNAPYSFVGYSTAEYNAIAALAGCGYLSLPAAS
jgi:hypothetical protein